MTEIVAIDRLGHRGDGIADTPAGALFVAHVLPGETVEVERTGKDRARLLRVLQPSAHRIDVGCIHVGACGGCAVQHLAAEAARAWKRGLVADALRQAGVEAEVGGTIDAHGAGRRRVTLHARWQEGRPLVGFSEARGHGIAAIDFCPLLVPALEPVFPLLDEIARRLGPGKPVIDAHATATDSGLDVDLRGIGRLDDSAQLALARIARKYDLARLSLHGEVLLENRPPVVRMGRAQLRLPPGSFLQPTEAGETALSALVLGATESTRSVADLFAGVGTFALRLAERANVFAAESERTAVEALSAAARSTPGLRPVDAVTRDLMRRPLAAEELSRFEAVVFDPPRAGAEAQAKALAVSAVPRLVAVSCNPATLARDLSILIGGGYRVRSVTPVDQFRHAAHVEAVAVLEKETAAPKKRRVRLS